MTTEGPLERRDRTAADRSRQSHRRSRSHHNFSGGHGAGCRRCVAGSSLIVSDEAVSKETGKSTDFIVLVSTEPQGGIKKRPKQFFRGDNFNMDSSDDYYYSYDRYGRRQMYPRHKSFFGWW